LFGRRLDVGTLFRRCFDIVSTLFRPCFDVVLSCFDVVSTLLGAFLCFTHKNVVFCRNVPISVETTLNNVKATPEQRQNNVGFDVEFDVDAMLCWRCFDVAGRIPTLDVPKHRFVVEVCPTASKQCQNNVARTLKQRRIQR